MATPALIYAFDDLEPTQFAQMCGRLLAAKYPGFLFSSVGPDGGIDAEVDPWLGEWVQEIHDPIIPSTIEAKRTFVFQFKHVVVARAGGEANARANLLQAFKSSAKKKTEMHSDLVQKKRPDIYVLVTNVEVNSVFREKFIGTCKETGSGINHIQIVGLDDLEGFLHSQTSIAQEYFPRIFGQREVGLRLKVQYGLVFPNNGNRYINFDWQAMKNGVWMLQVKVANLGRNPAYIDNIGMQVEAAGQMYYATWTLHLHADRIMERINPRLRDPIPSGANVVFQIPCLAATKMIADIADQLGQPRASVYPVALYVTDGAGNVYTEPLSKDEQNELRQPIVQAGG